MKLTEHLLSIAPEEYKAATQAPFLLAAAEGRLSKDVLGRWLANDRLYIHSYIRAAGKLLTSLELPQTVPKSGDEPPETQLVDWLIEALAAVRREERFFIEVAERYGLEIDLVTRRPIGPAEPGSALTVSVEDKLPGLVKIEELFGSITSTSSSSSDVTATDHPNTPTILPWLEAAVMFWGTERCYLDAWSWAKAKQQSVSSGSEDDARDDADGGALRREFIPNWSSDEFAAFVTRLETIIDVAVDKAIERGGEEVRRGLCKRVEGKWRSLLVAESVFWPEVE
jgi:thiaminase